MTGLAERIVPARGAAQKASAIFAGQLTDSPGRSDESSNPFREPTQRTKSVKYRYTATGKHLSSPLKGSSSSPETKPATTRHPKLPTYTPAPSSRAANVPAVATTSRKRKASPSIRKEDILATKLILSPSPLSSAPTSPALSTADLPLVPPPKLFSISKTFSLHTLGTTSAFSTSSQPLSQKKKQKKTKTEPKNDGWDIGNSVWVFINQAGVLADNPRNNADTSELLMWWPAQVVQKQPLRVSLFGNFPSSSSTGKGLCTIFNPSPANVQLVNDDSGAKRFSRATFCLAACSTGDDTGPPSKKLRMDDPIADQWEAAVQSMEKVSTLAKEGLPSLLSSYATTDGTFDDSDPDASDLRQSLLKPSAPKIPNSMRKLKSQRSRANLKVDTSPARSWSPCPADPTLEIPGELIFAMAPKTGGAYWPAKVLAHVPDRKERYRVKFLDDEEHVITRDRFWTSAEEGFVHCTLGEWESAVKTVEDPDSGDEGGDDDANADDSQDADTPLPPPPPADEFDDLSIRAQLAYVKPVLRAILNKEYAPARMKHDVFIKGGPARAELLKSAGVRGGMDARFVEGVQKVICEWVLGKKGIQPSKLDMVNVATEPDTTGGGTIVGDVSQETAPSLSPVSTQDNKMESIEGAIALEEQVDKKNSGEGGPLPVPVPGKPADAPGFDMVVDAPEQQAVLRSANGITLSPAIKHASLAPKSQLDLLAEVSQAVATEPSLLPSHPPEVPKLKVDPLHISRKDSTPLLSPLTPVPDEGQLMACRRNVLAVCEEFENLSTVEKLDYCLNILLPESIQQLLLWRSGERISSELLSPEEEQRLHNVGASKAAETDWVDNVMRLRAVQARLLGIDSNKKVEEKKAESGTRSRPRRGTVLRP